MRAFVKGTGRYVETSRVRVDGFGRSLSGKAVHANKKVLQSARKGGKLGGRGSGKEILGRGENGHYFYQDGEIDLRDRKSVNTNLKNFYADTVSSNIEKCLVLAQDGKKYMAVGDLDTVDTSLLGSKMKGSINIHNHVKSRTQYSFSKEDIYSFLEDGSSKMVAFDDKYTYFARRTARTHEPENISVIYHDCKCDAFEKCKVLSDYEHSLNLQHELISQLSKECGISYRRAKNAR